jgi:hypothetical protein
MNRAPSLDVFNRLLLQECAYFLNDLDLSEFSVFGDDIDPLQLPPKETADSLIEAYFSTLHPVFPILSQKEFMIQYHSYYQMTHAPNNSFLWIAILNVVFALGAIHAHYLQAAFRGPENDHIIYSTRSQMLSQELGQMPDQPTMEQVQLITIRGMYYITTCRINRNVPHCTLVHLRAMR